MKDFFKVIICFLFFISSSFAQNASLKKAQKLLKEGSIEQAAIELSSLDYLMLNASSSDKIHFNYIKGSTFLILSNINNFNFNSLSKSIDALNEVIQLEKEYNKYKYSTKALESLAIIKEQLVISAFDDLKIDDFKESSKKFHQAYVLDTKDTLLLYQSAINYKKASEFDLAFQCFEELKNVNYSGNEKRFLAYNIDLKRFDYFDSKAQRDEAIKEKSHIAPKEEIICKKGEIYTELAYYYAQKGFKEKALKLIAQAREYNKGDVSLAITQANLYLETKDYEKFDTLVAEIIDSNPINNSLISSFGIKCLNENYEDGAAYYFKKAISYDPTNVKAYLNLSLLYVNRNFPTSNQLTELNQANSNKKRIAILNQQKKDTIKMITPYLQKIISLDPYNSSVGQILESLNNTESGVSIAVASEE